MNPRDRVIGGVPAMVIFSAVAMALLLNGARLLREGQLAGWGLAVGVAVGYVPPFFWRLAAMFGRPRRGPDRLVRLALLVLVFAPLTAGAALVLLGSRAVEGFGLGMVCQCFMGFALLVKEDAGPRGA